MYSVYPGRMRQIFFVGVCDSSFQCCMKLGSVCKQSESSNDEDHSFYGVDKE